MTKQPVQTKAPKDDLHTFTKPVLISIMRGARRKIAKQAKRIAELEGSLADVERVTQPAMHVTPKPPAFPWDVQ
jgi:hypothetical protein